MYKINCVLEKHNPWKTKQLFEFGSVSLSGQIIICLMFFTYFFQITQSPIFFKLPSHKTLVDMFCIIIIIIIVIINLVGERYVLIICSRKAICLVTSSIDLKTVNKLRINVKYLPSFSFFLLRPLLFFSAFDGLLDKCQILRNIF